MSTSVCTTTSVVGRWGSWIFGPVRPTTVPCPATVTGLIGSGFVMGIRCITTAPVHAASRRRPRPRLPVNRRPRPRRPVIPRGNVGIPVSAVTMDGVMMVARGRSVPIVSWERIATIVEPESPAVVGRPRPLRFRANLILLPDVPTRAPMPTMAPAMTEARVRPMRCAPWERIATTVGCGIQALDSASRRLEVVIF